MAIDKATRDKLRALHADSRAGLFAADLAYMRACAEAMPAILDCLEAAENDCDQMARAYEQAEARAEKTEARCEGLASALEHAERTLRSMASDARRAIAAHAGSAHPVDDASLDDAVCCKCNAPAARQTRMAIAPWCIDIWYYCDAHAPKSARPIAPHDDAAAKGQADEPR